MTLTRYTVQLSIKSTSFETLDFKEHKALATESCQNQGHRLEWVLENHFSYFSTKTYIVGTQNNRLNEKVLLSTQNTCLNWWVRKMQF